MLLGPSFASHAGVVPLAAPCTRHRLFPTRPASASRSLVVSDASARSSSASGSGSRGDGPGAESRRRRSRRDDDDDGVEEKGWWEVPEERSMQAYAVEALEAWQTRRLEQAFALEGRRKMKIQGLAEELGLDRGRVLAWVKEFSGLPSEEREAILSKQRVEGGKQRQAEQQRLQAEQAAAAEAAAAAKLQKEAKGQGFVPFYTRKEAGELGGPRKRMPADVSRTLESIYRRTPFPSDDMVKGVYELHKMHREAVLAWFVERRGVDGIVSSTEKRRARPRGGSASVYIQDGEEEGAGGSGPRGDRGAARGNEQNMLMSLMSDGTPDQETEQKVKVVKITRAEMATLRSSMPSRKKVRGRKLAEDMGIKMDEEDVNALQIGDTRFVTESAEQATARWTQSWRFKRTTGAAPAPVNVRKSQGTK